MRNNEDGLFPALEAALKVASEPMDCHTLYEISEVSQHAASVNRVSDYLGNLWRKGVVVRLPAPKEGSSRSRWLYEWKGHRGPIMHGEAYAAKFIVDRPTMLVSEDGGTITIELTDFIISIRSKTKH